MSLDSYYSFGDQTTLAQRAKRDNRALDSQWIREHEPSERLSNPNNNLDENERQGDWTYNSSTGLWEIKLDPDIEAKLNASQYLNQSIKSLSDYTPEERAQARQALNEQLQKCDALLALLDASIEQYKDEGRHM